MMIEDLGPKLIGILAWLLFTLAGLLLVLLQIGIVVGMVVGLIKIII